MSEISSNIFDGCTELFQPRVSSPIWRGSSLAQFFIPVLVSLICQIKFCEIFQVNIHVGNTVRYKSEVNSKLQLVVSQQVTQVTTGALFSHMSRRLKMALTSRVDQ